MIHAAGRIKGSKKVKKAVDNECRDMILYESCLTQAVGEGPQKAAKS